MSASKPGQFLGSYVVNRGLTTRLVQRFSWVFATQERKKDNPQFLGSYVVNLVLTNRLVL